MKIEKATYLSVLLLLSLCLLGCKDKNAPEIPGEIIIMKFKQPENKIYILGHYPGGDIINTIRVNRCAECVGQATNMPYWELSNDWLLLDWKWYDIPHGTNRLISGYTVLTNLTWDQYEQGITPPFQTWSFSEPHVFDPIEAICFIQPDTLEKYSHATYGTKVKDLISATENWNAAEKLGLCTMADTMDSIWTILQRDLSVAIENGDLGKITK